MVYDVIWSEESIGDIESIVQWIGRDSVHYARLVADRLFAMGNSLHSEPLRGRIVPEINNPQVRECFVYSYRVIYEVSNGVVEILTILHGRRLLDIPLK